jgi:hypothetical protein
MAEYVEARALAADGLLFPRCVQCSGRRIAYATLRDEPSGAECLDCKAPWHISMPGALGSEP